MIADVTKKDGSFNDGKWQELRAMIPVSCVVLTSLLCTIALSAALLKRFALRQLQHATKRAVPMKLTVKLDGLSYKDGEEQSHLVMVNRAGLNLTKTTIESDNAQAQFMHSGIPDDAFDSPTKAFAFLQRFRSSSTMQPASADGCLESMSSVQQAKPSSTMEPAPVDGGLESMSSLFAAIEHVSGQESIVPPPTLPSIPAVQTSSPSESASIIRPIVTASSNTTQEDIIIDSDDEEQSDDTPSDVTYTPAAAVSAQKALVDSETEKGSPPRAASRKAVTSSAPRGAPPPAA